MGSSIYLTQDELVELTGYKRPGAQIIWLEENHIPHFVSRIGRPIVLRVTLTSSKPMPEQQQEPSFDALRD